MPVDLHREATGQASPNGSEEARNLSTAIRQAISALKQTHLAEAMGVSEATANRIVNGERGVTLDEMHAFFSALSMAVIQANSELVTLTQAEFDAYRTFARKGIDDDRRNRRPA